MVKINLQRFHKSLGKELIVTRNRVRDIIGAKNWAEEGRYKEVLLRNFLTKYLPDSVGVGTGFIVASKETCSHQIDIILYDKNKKLYFRENEFVVCHPKSVIGIIEVKTRITSSSEFKKIFRKATENGMVVRCDNWGDNFFNGIFVFENFQKNIDTPFKSAIKATIDSFSKHTLFNNSQQDAKLKKLSLVSTLHFGNNLLVNSHDLKTYFKYELKGIATSAFSAVLLKKIGFDLTESEKELTFPKQNKSGKQIYP